MVLEDAMNMNGNVTYGRDYVYPVRTSKVGCLLLLVKKIEKTATSSRH